MAILNLAFGFSILLAILSVKIFNLPNWLIPPGFCGVLVALYVLFHSKWVRKYVNTGKPVSYVFGLANMSILLGVGVFMWGAQEGANALAAGMFVGAYFIIPALALYLTGSIILGVQATRNIMLAKKAS